MLTGFYAGLLTLLYIRLSLDVIGARHHNKISLGTGPNGEISALVAAHGNFAAYVPLFLLLCYLAEAGGHVPTVALHLLAAAFTVGRLLHYLAFKAARMNFKLRVAGMHLTLWPLLLMALVDVAAFGTRLFAGH